MEYHGSMSIDMFGWVLVLMFASRPKAVYNARSQKNPQTYNSLAEKSQDTRCQG